MRRLALFALVPLLLLWPARVQALTVRDVIELTKAGLGEQVLLALIDVDRSVFPIDTPTLTQLKEARVPETVIEAMVRSGRGSSNPEPIAVADPVPAPAPEPQVVVIDHHDAPEIREVPVAYPVYVPYYVVGPARDGRRGVGRRPEESAEPRAEPVYWGFGGKARPDAWRPAAEPTVRKKPE